MKSRYLLLTIGICLTLILIWQLRGSPSYATTARPVKDKQPSVSGELQNADPDFLVDSNGAVATTNLLRASSAPRDTSGDGATINDAATLAEYEQQFFLDNNLRIDKLIAATEAEQFTSLFHSLDTLAVAPAMRERTQQMGEKIRSLPALQAGTISLQRFACGTRFCAASFFSQDEGSWEQFRSTLSEQLALPDGGVSFENHSGEQGGWERRLIFSTDGSQTGGAIVQTNSAVTLPRES